MTITDEEVRQIALHANDIRQTLVRMLAAAG